MIGKKQASHTICQKEWWSIWRSSLTPDKKLISHESIAGGCANLNFKIQLENEKHPLILRLYLRDKDAAAREQKLAALIKETVPAPLTHYIGCII